MQTKVAIAAVGALLSVACGSTDTPTPIACPGDAATLIRPSHWQQATHCNGMPADYAGLFGADEVHRFDIEISESDHEAMMADLASKLSGGVPGSGPQSDPIYVPVTVAFDGEVWTEVGMRYKGNSSLRSAWQSGIRKLAFRLNFDRFEDEHPQLDNQRFFGFEEMTFSNGFRDRSLIRDRIAGDIFRAGGVVAARAAFARVYVDFGEGSTYFGLYTMIEDPSDQLTGSQFGEDGGNLYKPDGPGATWQEFIEADFAKKTNEVDADFSDVVAAIDALHADRTDAAVWREGLEATFDVGVFLRCLALNQTMVNWDSYGFMAHNYYVYGDPQTGGKLSWFPWDLNESLVVRLVDGVDASSVLLDEIDDEWPLIRYLLDDATYRQMYLDELQGAIDGAFVVADVQQQVQTYHDLISPFVVGEQGESAPYTFLRDSDEFSTSLTVGGDSLFPHIEARHAAVAAVLSASP